MATNNKAMLLVENSVPVVNNVIYLASLDVPPWTPFQVGDSWYFSTFQNNIYKCSTLVNP